MKKGLTFIALLVFLFAFSGMQIRAHHTSNTASSSILPGGAYLVFAGKMGGEVSIAELKKQKSLNVSGCASGSTIMSFTLLVHRKGTEALTYKGTKAELSELMLKALASLKAGDSFSFTKVKATMPSGGKVDVWAKKYTVV